MIRPPPKSTLFPYPPLSRSPDVVVARHFGLGVGAVVFAQIQNGVEARVDVEGDPLARGDVEPIHELVRRRAGARRFVRSEEHTSELQSRQYLVCRLLLEKKK